jgi:hypothetical protein
MQVCTVFVQMYIYVRPVFFWGKKQKVELLTPRQEKEARNKFATVLTLKMPLSSY